VEVIQAGPSRGGDELAVDAVAVCASGRPSRRSGRRAASYRVRGSYQPTVRTTPCGAVPPTSACTTTRDAVDAARRPLRRDGRPLAQRPRHPRHSSPPGTDRPVLFHAKTDSGAFFSFPLWWPPSGRGRPWRCWPRPTPGTPTTRRRAATTSMASRVIDRPVVNSRGDLPRYQVRTTASGRAAPTSPRCRFERPEPYQPRPEGVNCMTPSRGGRRATWPRRKWRLLGWAGAAGLRPRPVRRRPPARRHPRPGRVPRCWC